MRRLCRQGVAHGHGDHHHAVSDDQPFELLVASATNPEPRQVCRSADYRYVRSAAIRRVSMHATLGQESPSQTNRAEVWAKGDLLFKIRRLTKLNRAGEVVAGLVIDRDWRLEDSPFLGRVRWDDGTVD